MQRLPETELDIMLALWDAEKPPVPRNYFDEKLADKNWSVNALNSFLSRLEEKGFLSSEKKGKNKFYRAEVSREKYISQESRSILKKLYRGSVKNFILSIADQDGLDDSEIDELQQYLEKLKEGQD